MQLQRRTHIENALEGVNYRHLNLVDAVWIFAVVSVLGLIGETLVSYPIDGIWKNRTGYIWGPFSPIYGLGAVLMSVAGDRTRHRGPLAVFLLCAVMGAALEFFGGYMLQKFFGILAWDYSNQPFNIMGRTSLGFACVWGTLGVVWAYTALPHIPALIDRMPRKVREYGALGMAIFFAADSVFTLIAFDCWWCELAGKVATTPLQQSLRDIFNVSFMTDRFQTITIWPDTASRLLS